MSLSSTLPWPQINDFIVEVGAAGNDQEFIRRVIRLIGTLVPSDLDSVFGVIDSEGKLCAPKTVISNVKWFHSFTNHYWRLTPDVSQEQGANAKAVDWNNYHDTEYVADFMAPQQIRYSLGVQNIGKFPGGYLGTLALNRSKASRPFNEREQRIMEVLQPHLSNFYWIFTQGEPQSPPTPAIMELSDQFPSLTQREIEIATLLCRRYSTRMLESQLFISRKTLYKHIEHIFTKLGVTSRDELLKKVTGDIITG